MYVQETVQAGPVIEVKKYHTSRYRTPAMPRSKNHERTSAEQWKVNEKNSIRQQRGRYPDRSDIRRRRTGRGRSDTPVQQFFKNAASALSKSRT